ncbi:Gfo/Idh/MocA family oxidoreductase [Lentibacter sp.]|uniref:Gfo/Idh/MocA family oxidoreductase n=1 Tax=Lentibacter sp. TaxID=2024994 RepID=UPI003F6A1C3A
MQRVAIVGCGFVADLYMRSFAVHPEIEVVSCYDRDAARLAAFSKHWNVAAAADLAAVFTEVAGTGLLLN